MKKLIHIFCLLILINTTILITPQNAPAQGRIVSFQVFYDNLSPYGTWFQSANYGYVWRPNVGAGFSPYSTNGYWAYTDAGWAWVSDYDWGWAPFHYGRWYNDPSYGYTWVPDYDWGPGWVTWRRSDDYYGWAPIGPGINIDLAYSNGYNIPYNYWRFVRCNDFGRRNINNYYINTTNNTTIINNTTVINNTRVDNTRNTKYNIGPDKVEVEKKAGTPINTVVIKDQAKPAQRFNGKELELYRPVIDKNANAATKPAPAKVIPVKDVKADQNNNTVQQPVKTPIKEENNNQPVKLQPVKEQNINQQPVKQQPIKEQPIKQQPVREQKINEQPIKQQPVKEQPVMQEPVREQKINEPVKQQPIKLQPVMQEPVRKQKIDEEPIKTEGNNNQPVKQEPTQNQQPSREQNINEQPVKQQPIQPQENKPQQIRKD